MIMDNFYNSAGAFKLGDFVQKKSGSSWRGKVVGFYATDMTPRGYCVESTNEPGSVQIYPETALVEWKPELSHPSAIRETVEGERAACLAAVGFSAWRHEGMDSYSQGLDEGARKQHAACYEAIRARGEEKGQ
jgi:dihydrofolate reductase (trimethoprim resistance protein)